MMPLATLAIARPDDATTPSELAAIVRTACAGSFRALEIVLCGEALHDQLATAREPALREAVEALLALAGRPAARPDAAIALREARSAGVLDQPFAIDVVVDAAARAGDVPALPRDAITQIRRELAAHPAIEAALGESDVAALLADSARAIVRHLVRGDAELERWAVAPTGLATRDRALVTLAELVASPAATAELDDLLARACPAPSVPPDSNA